MPDSVPRIVDTPEWRRPAGPLRRASATPTSATSSPTNPTAATTMILEAGDLYLDYSKNRLTAETIGLLAALARTAGVEQLRDAMFAGEKINITEQRAVLHVALRAPAGEQILVDGVDVVPEVHAVLDKMGDFSNRVRSGAWTGHTGKRIRNVVNIGIGGSDLGPRMATTALADFSDRSMTFRFVSNVDGTDFYEATRDLDPEETLFIIASKTFTTLETMTNAAHALATGRSPRSATTPRWRSTSSRCRPTRTRSRSSGSTPTNMFEFWDWVGGRYSYDSAIGLSLMIAIGPDAFGDMLAGLPRDGRALPRPRRSSRTCRCSSGSIGIWYDNFFGAETVAILPYSQYLAHLPAYFQQLDMESNGKSVDREGERVEWQTGPIVWGQPGTNGQHAYYQLIHQGTKLIPADFIGFAQAERGRRRPPGPAHREPARPAGGARVRQDPRGGRGRGHSRPPGAAPGVRGQPPDEHDPGDEAHAARRSASSSRCTSTRCSPRARSGTSTRSTSGASSWARSSRRTSSRSCSATDDADARARLVDQRAHPPLPAPALELNRRPARQGARRCSSAWWDSDGWARTSSVG